MRRERKEAFKKHIQQITSSMCYVLLEGTKSTFPEGICSCKHFGTNGQASGIIS